MDKYLHLLPMFVDKIREIREIIISNIVLIGQIPAPTFHEKRRAEHMVERLAEFQVVSSAGRPRQSRPSLLLRISIHFPSWRMISITR
jgi:hypothetical protein